MRELSSTLTSKGQVTIPKPIRERMGVGPHDKVVFVMEGDVVKIARRESVVQRTAGIMRSDVSFATAEEMRAAAEEAIAADALQRMNNG
jgi:AbrB family looped-hinge helix DNA binding protein